MSSLQETDSKRDLGSLLVAAFFIVAGFITLYDTSSYSDIDSKVFPRAAAIVLIVCSLLSLTSGMLKPFRETGFGTGSWWRRLLLVISLLVACLLMPSIGFLPAGILAFVGCMLASMHQKWTTVKIALYSASGLLIMISFYALFRYALHVPLP